MNRQPGIHSRQAALERAGQLTTELLELVAKLRAEVDDGEDHPVPNTGPVNGRLRSGDLRAAFARANRRPARQVPDLLG